MTYEEREIKFFIQDLNAMEERLRRSGADCVRPRTLERNFRLDTMERSLEKSGRLLRIRQDDQVRITYKESGQVDNNILARKEIEFIADDFEVAKTLFEALGYQVVVIYEKYRQIYQLGDVEVTLDTLPFGDFMEIEAPNNTLIEGVAQMLGLDWSRGMSINYLGLFEVAKQRARLDFRDLTFENFDFIRIKPDVLGLKPADA
jgi:adenylate cyclase class 2